MAKNAIANAVSSEFNAKAYDLLITMGGDVKLGEKAKKKAQEKVEGGYTVGMRAAALCKSREEWNATIAKLENNIRKNVGNLAVRFGADRAQKEDKNGNKYKIPSSVSTVKSLVKWAFDNGRPFVDEDGNVRTYGELNAERAAVKEADRLKAAENLTGIDKLRHDLKVALGKLADSVKEMDEATLREWIAKLTPPKATKVRGNGRKRKPEAATSGERLAA